MGARKSIQDWDKVKTYPEGRVCKKIGCCTVLSIYNHSQYCRMHATEKLIEVSNKYADRYNKGKWQYSQSA